MDRYAAWIQTHVDGNGRGQCAAITRAMEACFPELRRVRGHYLDPIRGRRPHWWCVLSDGTIVDPTVAQFSGCGEYEPLSEEDEEPLGKCVNCGEFCWQEFGSSTFCSRNCAVEMQASFATSWDSDD